MMRRLLWAPYVLLTCPLLRVLDWLGRDVPVVIARAEQTLTPTDERRAA